MKHYASPRFWQCYEQLPENVRAVADRNFELLKVDTRHPSLHFKTVGRFAQYASAWDIAPLRLRVTAILFGSGLEPMPSMTSSFKVKRNRFAEDTTYFGIGFGGTVRI